MVDSVLISLPPGYTQRGVAAIEVKELLTHNYVEGEPITAETACQFDSRRRGINNARKCIFSW